VDVADGAELVRVVGGVVVADGDFEVRLLVVVIRRPLPEMPGELRVGHDVDAINAPMGARLSSTCSTIGLPATGNSGFGWLSVSGKAAWRSRPRG